MDWNEDRSQLDNLVELCVLLKKRNGFYDKVLLMFLHECLRFTEKFFFPVT